MPMRLMNIASVKAAAAALPASFALIEVTTGQAALAAVCSLLAAVLAAWLATRPGVIREKAQSRMAEEERHLSWYRERIEYNSSRAELVRASKHKCLNYIEACHGHMDKCYAALKAGGAEPPAFERKYYDDLCGEEDRVLALLALPAEIHTTKSE